MKIKLILGLLVLVLFIIGCSKTPTGQVTKCPELDYSKCPQQKCPELDCSNCPKVEKTKYVCSDGIVMNSEEDCKRTSVSEAQERGIDKSKIESIIISEDSRNMISLIKNENNLLETEYKVVYSSESYLIESLYAVTKNVISYLDNINSDTNIKITVLNAKGNIRKTTTLSWNDAEKIIKYEMSYDEWLNTVK